MSRKANFFKDMKQVIHKNLEPMRNNYKETYDAVMKFLKYQKHLDQLGQEDNDTLIIYLIGEEIIDWVFNNFDMLYKMNIVKNDESSIIDFIYSKVYDIGDSYIKVSNPNKLATEVL